MSACGNVIVQKVSICVQISRQNSFWSTEYLHMQIVLQYSYIYLRRLTQNKPRKKITTLNATTMKVSSLTIILLKTV